MGLGDKELSVCQVALTVIVTAAGLNWEGIVTVGQPLGRPIRDHLDLVGRGGKNHGKGGQRGSLGLAV